MNEYTCTHTPVHCTRTVTQYQPQTDRFCPVQDPRQKERNRRNMGGKERGKEEVRKRGRKEERKDGKKFAHASINFQNK